MMYWSITISAVFGTVNDIYSPFVVRGLTVLAMRDARGYIDFLN